ncbi:ATP-binding protein [Sphaerisporangium sp. NPDC051011]|uniref:ATP-binding protein n=1 Tax=Sphaerisporangium sp. NPDC051011 TaxID=3155792 RepID=UPI0034112F19
MRRERRLNLDGRELPVRVARSETDKFLAELGLLAEGETVLLVVSELVTNAVRYGAAPVILALRLFEAGLCVEVTDGCPQMPVGRPGDENGGFGLDLAGELAALSFHPLAEGKVVRAFVPLAPSSCPLAEEIVRLVVDGCGTHDLESSRLAVARLLRDLETDLQLVHTGR